MYNKTSTFNFTKWILFFLILFLSLFVRFFPNNYPENNGLVFDEAYFVPQTESYVTGRYFFDIHPSLGRFFLYHGMMLFNPDIKLEEGNVCEEITDEALKTNCYNTPKIDPTKVGNKPETYRSNLNLQGIRFFPRVFGSLIPPLLFLVVWEFLNRSFTLIRRNVPPRSSIRGENYIIPFLIGLMGALENSWIIESRHALQTPFLMFFILLTIFFGIKYFNYDEIKRKLSHNYKENIFKSIFSINTLFFIFTGLSLGLATSVKWLGLGVLPFLALVILFKTYRSFVYERDVILQRVEELSLKTDRAIPTRIVRLIYSRIGMLVTLLGHVIVKTGILCIIGALVYFAVFSWHFSMLKFPSNEENNNTELKQFCEQCYLDLQNNTNNASIFDKILAQTEIAAEYNKKVVSLDYSKPDEIGSEWLKWPLMSRIILNYYSAWNGDLQSEYRFLSLIGNPVNWYLGLIGVIVLSSLVITRILGNSILWEYSAGRYYFYILLLALYFSNWLPFYFVERVMYLYHYMPALMISMIIFGVVLEDVIFTKLHLISAYVSKGKTASYIWSNSAEFGKLNIISLIFYLLLITLVVFSYFFYYPFTYFVTIHKDEFNQRVLVKDWGLKWPGK